VGLCPVAVNWRPASLAMRCTLQEHIVQLEEKIQRLRDELTKPTLVSVELQRIASELQVAELALTYY
jgi:ABC-type phosphate transport system auxiliary subunit